MELPSAAQTQQADASADTATVGEMQPMYPVNLLLIYRLHCDEGRHERFHVERRVKRQLT
jgi:hypothetical protein